MLLNETINSKAATEFIKTLHDVNEFDTKQEEKEANLINKKFVRKPISVIICSGGGSVYDGFTIINEILESRTPVHTYCSGIAGSMAACIFLAGKERIIRPNSSVVFHAISSGNYGDIQKVREYLQEMEFLQDKLIGWITSRCRIGVKRLRQIETARKDLYIHPTECMELGIATELRDYP